MFIRFLRHRDRGGNERDMAAFQLMEEPATSALNDFQPGLLGTAYIFVYEESLRPWDGYDDLRIVPTESVSVVSLEAMDSVSCINYH